MKEPGSSSFEATYPAITRWVKEFGRVGIGPDELMDNFVTAIDRGGMPWGGKGQYESIDEALRDMENGIKAFLEAQGLDERSSPRQRPTKRSARKARKSPTEASKDQPPIRGRAKGHQTGQGSTGQRSDSYIASWEREDSEFGGVQGGRTPPRK